MLCWLFFRKREGAAVFHLLRYCGFKEPIKDTDLCFDTTASFLKMGRRWSALQVIRAEFPWIPETDLPYVKLWEIELCSFYYKLSFCSLESHCYLTGTSLSIQKATSDSKRLTRLSDCTDQLFTGLAETNPKRTAGLIFGCTLPNLKENSLHALAVVQNTFPLSFKKFRRKKSSSNRILLNI